MIKLFASYIDLDSEEDRIKYIEDTIEFIVRGEGSIEYRWLEEKEIYERKIYLISRMFLDLNIESHRYFNEDINTTYETLLEIIDILVSSRVENHILSNYNLIKKKIKKEKVLFYKKDYNNILMFIIRLFEEHANTISKKLDSNSTEDINITKVDVEKAELAIKNMSKIIYSTSMDEWRAEKMDMENIDYIFSLYKILYYMEANGYNISFDEVWRNPIYLVPLIEYDSIPRDKVFKAIIRYREGTEAHRNYINCTEEIIEMFKNIKTVEDLKNMREYASQLDSDYD